MSPDAVPQAASSPSDAPPAAMSGAGAGSGAAGAAGAAGAMLPPMTQAGSSSQPPLPTDAGTAAGSSGETAGGPAPMVPPLTDPPPATDPDCDFSGVWIAKQLTVSEALGLWQTTNNWFYLEFQQSGDQVTFTKSLDCGIEVRGTATVTLSRATLQALLTSNSQNGRKATLKKADNKCAFETPPFWKIRGADEQRFIPNATRDSLDSIPKVAMDKPLPTRTMTDGAIDMEGDGKLGMAVQLNGVISGVRNSVQRDWSRWFTEPGFEITPSRDWPSDLRIRTDFDNEESILDPTTGLLAAGALPARGAKHELKLRFLGRDRSDPRVVALLKSSDIETCYAIQDAMPPESLQ